MKIIDLCKINQIIALLVFSIILSNSSIILQATATVVADEILVSSDEFINAGTYPVTIYRINEVTGKEEATTIFMTVTKPYTVLSDIEGIDAYDALVPEGTLAEMTDSNLIQITNAHAWQLSDGRAIPVTKVIRETLQNSPFTLSITFETERSTAITVKVLEMGETVLPLQESYISQQSEAVVSFMQRYIFALFTVLVAPMITLLAGVYIFITLRVKKIQKMLFPTTNLEK
jgi:hypothetical protein